LKLRNTKFVNDGRSIGIRVPIKSHLQSHKVIHVDATAWSSHLRAAPSRTWLSSAAQSRASPSRGLLLIATRYGVSSSLQERQVSNGSVLPDSYWLLRIVGFRTGDDYPPSPTFHRIRYSK